MDIEDFKKAAKDYGYGEEDIFHGHPEECLKDFVQYRETTLELKIYLAELIIYRHFMAMGATLLPADVDWFIEEYFSDFEGDYILPERTRAVNQAKELIMTGDLFGKTPIGSSFMFGIIERYAKHKLGFRPHRFDFFDKKGKNAYIKKYEFDKNDIYLKGAFDKLENLGFPISESLKKINSKTSRKMKELSIEEERFVLFGISDRLSIARNAMVHGESHTFFYIGRYMLMLYILFQLNELKENPKVIDKHLFKLKFKK